MCVTVCAQAQAEARAEALRQLASLQLRALGQAALQRDKPKLVLALCAHAPKVAVRVRGALLLPLLLPLLVASSSSPPAQPFPHSPRTCAAVIMQPLASLETWSTPGCS